MKANEINQRVRRFDILDMLMMKAAWVLIGVFIASYWTGLRGTVQQNWWVFVFVIIAIAVRPIVKYFR